MIDERIAVVLASIGSIVALNFLFAHGVVAMPLKQHVKRPCAEHWIVVAGKHVARPVGNLVIVAGGHVEISACKVALVHVVGLKNYS